MTLLNKKIGDFIDLLKTLGNLRFDGVYYYISEEKSEILSSAAVPFDVFGNELQINFHSFFDNVRVAIAEEKNFGLSNSDIFSDILVIDITGSCILFDSTKKQFETFGNSNPSLLSKFVNLVAYFKIFNFFSSDDFSDYYNDADNEIVLYSSINGIFKIHFENVPVISDKNNLPNNVDRLIELGSSIEINPFLKNAFSVIANKAGSIHLNEILDNTDGIVEITRRDYELVSKKFDFEKFRDTLSKEMEKYFFSIREIISKIFGQVIGIPISISATVFATYKVSDDIFMLIIVGLAFFAFSIFYLKIQFVYREEIEKIFISFLSDYEIIKEKSGLPTAIIDKEKTKIEDATLRSLDMIDWLIGIILFLSLLVIIYIGYQIAFSKILDML